MSKFVRPRRFGKTLLCETLKCYYDVAEKGNFQALFGDLAIGRDPTDQANRYFVLMLDFSHVGICLGATWEEKFESYMNTQLDVFVGDYSEWLAGDQKVQATYLKPGAEAKFSAIEAAVHRL